MTKWNVARLSERPQGPRAEAKWSAERPGEGRHLGPAEVVDVAGGSVEARIESGRLVRAQLALSTPYEPAAGDVVLIIGEGDRSWVIGVISARGRTVLSFDGDVELRSNDGVVRIAGGKGVEIEAPELDLRSRALRIVAESVVERVVSLTQRVRELASVHVGRRHEIVDGATLTQAKSATFVTEDDVKINGKAIHLG